MRHPLLTLPLCLILLTSVVHGQSGECEQSDLGYACKKVMTDYYELHWSIGPTTAGAEAGDGEIAFAMVGQTNGWVGFAFAELEGSMAPGDFVIGYVDGGEAVVTPYRSEVQFISAADEDDAVMLGGVAGSENATHTIIQFVRSLTDGTTEILLDEEIPVNVAIRDDDTLNIHTQREPRTVTLNLASPDGSTPSDGGGSTAEAPGTATSQEASPPTTQPPATRDTEMPLMLDTNTAENGLPDLGYRCVVQQGQVTIHWTMGPADASGDIPAVEEGELAMAVSAATDGWVGIAFAEVPQSMNPADSVIGWVSGGAADIQAYEISIKSVANSDASTNIGIRDTMGTEMNGETLIQFVLTGEFTFSVNFSQPVDMNWAVGDSDSLSYHGSNKNSFTVDFNACAAESNSRSLKYYKAHGSMMIIAWIGLAPLGVLVARNKHHFMQIHERAWFEIHRVVQGLALIFMIIGLIIALAEFDDPTVDEGKRHRRVGISIITISLFQGLMGILRPNHDSSFRYIFNWMHWYIGRGAVILGIATVFLGINAFDLLNTDDVSRWWITCVTILGVYFVLAALGELFIAKKKDEEHKMEKQEPVRSELE